MKKLFQILLLILMCQASYGAIIPSTTDSAIDADKKIVIAKTVHEVFTNYSEKIDSLKKYFAPISLMGYIDTYLKTETANIETRITDKTYVKRYSKMESSWVDTDYAEVAALTREQTIDRIKQISEDIRGKASGVFSVMNDKLILLEKEVKAEIKD